MALPKLNSAPVYEMTIPSSGKGVTYRPFLVKEQKNLLIAFEAQNRRDIVRAIVRTIESCVENELDESLTTFDIDYMFTKIRSKSVGETSKITIPCEHCETRNEVSVELDSVEVKGDVVDDIIQLTDDITIKMKYPTYEEFLSNQNLSESPTMTETLIQLIITCMDSVMTEDEKFLVKDETNEDIQAFLESMTTDQFEKISDFANNIPTLSQEVVFTCSSCETENKKTLRGLDDFF